MLLNYGDLSLLNHLGKGGTGQRHVDLELLDQSRRSNNLHLGNFGGESVERVVVE